MAKSFYSVYKRKEFSKWAFAKGVARCENAISGSLSVDKSVLDVGTGGGRLLHTLKSRGFKHLTGFDYVEDLIEAARRRDPSGAIQFDIADARRLPYESGLFSQCLSLAEVVCCMERREDRIATLKELERVLQNDGTIYISFMFRGSRERTVPGYLLTTYLRLIRKFFHRQVSLSLQPCLKHGGRFNWGSIIDAHPYVYWYSLDEAMKDLRESGLTVEGIGDEATVGKGQWMNPDGGRIDTSAFKGSLYFRCRKY